MGDNFRLYDEVAFGKGKFGLWLGRNGQKAYWLDIKSISFKDAAEYFCQNGKGEKAKTSVTVVEMPSCLKGKTQLQEGESASYSCVVRAKGEKSFASNIHWNKENAEKEFKRNLSGITIISSQLKYRANFHDNGEKIDCYVSNPEWNNSDAIPKCSIGLLNIAFPPRLLCDSVQVFPDVPQGKYYVFCDIIANPIKEMNSVWWFLVSSGMEKRILGIENITRKDYTITHGLRSRINVPYDLIKENGNNLEFNVKMFHDGKSYSKGIKMMIHSSQPSTFMALSIALGGFVSLASLAICIYFHIHHKRSPNISGRQSLGNGSCPKGVMRQVKSNEGPESISDQPKDQPNNEKTVDVPKRKVRFKNNI